MLSWLITLALLWWGRGAGVVRASGGVIRQIAESREGPVYEWWVTRWEDHRVVCTVTVYHEGLPSLDEVAQNCGLDTAQTWQDTPWCADGISCQGVYLQLHHAGWRRYTVTVSVPPPQVWLQMTPESDCRPMDAGVICASPPMLRLEAEDPHPEGEVVRVAGALAGISFSCEGARCDVSLAEVSAQGDDLFFWADSSLGDRSPRYRARVRVTRQTVDRREAWRVDVLSVQWRGPLAACSEVWDAFPAWSGLPDWLSSPDALTTDQPYTLLAGQLIIAGLVDASACPQGGVGPDGAATPCGLEQARRAVAAWQNRFDPAIARAARAEGVPAALLKRLFAQESQFWPEITTSAGEYGLGQLTLAGVDALLLWSPQTYDEVCPSVLGEAVCRKGYATLSAEDQALLRGAVLRELIVPVCAGCDSPFDEEVAQRSVTLFARALRANCIQVDRVVRDVTRRDPGSVSSLEDLWRMTLLNYNAGPGCLSQAVQEAWVQGSLDWDAVVRALPPGCRGAVDYVHRLTRE